MKCWHASSHMQGRGLTNECRVTKSSVADSSHSSDSTTILTSSTKRPWTADGFGSSFYTASVNAKMDDRDLHFHDLRGTAATKFYLAGLSIRVIAEILAWTEEQVEKIIRRYVGRTAATKEAIRQLNLRGQSRA